MDRKLTVEERIEARELIQSALNYPWTIHPYQRELATRYMEEVAALDAELAVDEHLLEERARLIAAIPECEAHGACVPHAIEWVENAIKAEADKQIAVEALRGIAAEDEGEEYDLGDWEVMRRNFSHYRPPAIARHPRYRIREGDERWKSVTHLFSSTFSALCPGSRWPDTPGGSTSGQSSSPSRLVNAGP